MKFVLHIVFLFSIFYANASHIVGGEIYYDYLGGNNYRFYISVYRDCNSTGAAFDSPLSLGVFSGGALIQNVQVGFNGSQIVPVVFNNPCVTAPSNICTENSVYETIINLPPSVNGYTITYQRCCRGPNINNLINPDDTGFTLTCVVPPMVNNNYINNSPRFNDYPPLLLCNNEDLIFDHSATDPDGDQLIYSLITPFAGASSGAPQPNPPPAPPYFNVLWSGTNSAISPLGPGSSINIDPNTGLLTASPNLTGRYVVGIQVEEIRNGVVINRTMRDFIFQVFNCNLQLEAILPLQTDLPTFVSYCQGLTVDFVNQSYGGTNYAWDFGVAGTTNDVSTAFNPSFTYPANGQYQVMLVVNPGWPCTDTAYMDVLVNNILDVSFTSNDSLCIFDNSFDFIGSSTGPAGQTSYLWDFGPNASTNGDTTESVNNVQFSTEGFIPVTLTATFSVCQSSFTDSVYIFPEPTAVIDLPSNIECAGLTVPFGNASTGSINYEWDFGTTGLANSGDFEPSVVYPAAGVYTVQLIASSTPTCADTATATFELFDPIIVDFTSQDSMCVKNNSFDFYSQVSGPPNTVFTWDFGPYASVTSSTNTNELGVSFLATGTLPITLTGTHNNCVESVTHEIYIYQEPQINFTVEDALQCEPFPAQFINYSFAETSIQYFWDFGDGNTSNVENPLNIYTTAGSYPVTLTIVTTAGCPDTLTLTKQDLIIVHPSPTADFSLTPSETDICNSEITFIDHSSLAQEYFYSFDDSIFVSSESNPTHLYLTSGMHRPMQIVTTEFGCKDTSYQYVYIEPFTIYAPNTITVNGDGINEEFLPIVYLDVIEWKLEIYNRWGEIVFTTNDINQAWDGRTNTGELAQDGQYIWKINMITCEPIQPEKEIVGTINVLK